MKKIWPLIMMVLFILSNRSYLAHAEPVALSSSAVSAHQRPVRLPPLLWYEDDPQEARRELMAGLIYWDFQDHDRRQWAILPLVYRWQDADRHLLMGLPLVAGYGSPQEDWWLAGLFYGRRDSPSSQPASQSIGLFPLANVAWTSAGIQSQYVLPLYSYEKQKDGSTFFSLLFSRSRQTNDQWGHFGLYYYARHATGFVKGLFPFWHHEENPDSHRWAVPFLLTEMRQDREGHDYHFQYLLLGSVQRQGATVQNNFFPLYRYKQDEAQSRFWVPRGVPLAARMTSPDSRVRYVFPVGWGRSPDQKWDMVFPFYGRIDGADLRIFLLFPFYADAVNSRGRWRFVAPLWFTTERTSGEKTESFFPLYWRFQELTGDFRTVLPIYASSRQPGRQWSVLTPFWFSYSNPAGRRFHVLFPLYWRSVTTETPNIVGSATPSSRDVSVFLTGYRVNETKAGKETRSAGVAPFYSKTYTDGNNHYADILGGLLGKDVRDGYRSYRFLYFFYTRPASVHP